MQVSFFKFIHVSFDLFHTNTAKRTVAGFIHSMTANAVVRTVVALEINSYQHCHTSRGHVYIHVYTLLTTV